MYLYIIFPPKYLSLKIAGTWSWDSLHAKQVPYPWAVIPSFYIFAFFYNRLLHLAQYGVRWSGSSFPQFRHQAMVFPIGFHLGIFNVGGLSHCHGATALPLYFFSPFCTLGKMLLSPVSRSQCFRFLSMEELEVPRGGGGGRMQLQRRNASFFSPLLPT